MKNSMQEYQYQKEMKEFAFRECAERIAKEIEMHFKYFDEDMKLP